MLRPKPLYNLWLYRCRQKTFLRFSTHTCAAFARMGTRHSYWRYFSALDTPRLYSTALCIHQFLFRKKFNYGGRYSIRRCIIRLSKVLSCGAARLPRRLNIFHETLFNRRRLMQIRTRTREERMHKRIRSILKNRKGFSVIEFVVVASLVVLVGVATLVVLLQFRAQADLDSATEGIRGALGISRSRTLGSENASTYGVYFESATY